MRDRGAMLVLTVLVGLAISAAVTAAMVPVLSDLVDRQRARTAADAAALAGVADGRGAATTLASVNGGELVEWTATSTGDGWRVTVSVRVGDQVATARATDQP